MALVPALDLRPADRDEHPYAPGNEANIPANIEAEQALLGAVLYSNDAWLPCSHLRPEQFFEPFHSRLWDVIGTAVAKGQLAEPILVADMLEGDPAFAELGGVRYLADLVDRAPPPVNAPEYASAVSMTWARRELLRACAETMKAAVAGEVEPFSAIAAHRRDLDALEATAAPDDATMISAPDAAQAAFEAMADRARDGKVRGKLTGLRCIDRRLGGLRPGALIVIGGRPSMGKTSLGRAIVHGGAKANPDSTFAYLGIEMGPEEMMQRELSALTFEGGSGIEYRAMEQGKLDHIELQLIAEAAQRVPGNLILDDCPSLSIDDVRRKVWALKRRGHLAAIAIDYLQLMSRPLAKGRNEASVLGEITMALKQLARQARITIVLLSQLSREVEKRDDKRPQLSDLRDSGSIEQDADAVLFPFREVYYLERAEPKEGTPQHMDWEIRCADLRYRLDVICAKQRQGPVGSDRQLYRAEYDHISDVEDRP